MAVFTFHEVCISLRFPQKLWKIVNESKTNAIRWNRSGNSFLVDYKDFQQEYLNTTSNPFKTTRLQSFIRQLNLYGFRKVKGHMHPKELLDVTNTINVHEFFHVNFIRGRCDLLAKIVRKTDSFRVRTKKRNGPTYAKQTPNRVNDCQMALTGALEKVSGKYEIQDFKIKETTIKNEVVEAVANIIQENKKPEPESAGQDTWDYSKWLEETSSKYNTSSTANEIPPENNELTYRGATTQINIQELPGNETVIDENNNIIEVLNEEKGSNEETLAWDGIVYNDTSEQLYAMLLADEKKNIHPKVVTETLNSVAFQSPVYYDHRYSIPLNASTFGLIWN